MLHVELTDSRVVIGWLKSGRGQLTAELGQPPVCEGETEDVAPP